MYLLFQSLTDIERELLSVCVSDLITEYVSPVHPESAPLVECDINGHKFNAITPAHSLRSSDFYKDKAFINHYGSKALPFGVVNFLMDIGILDTSRATRRKSSDSVATSNSNGTMYCSRQSGGFRLFDCPTSCSSVMNISLSLAEVARSEWNSTHNISYGLELIGFQLSSEQYVRFMRAGEFGTPCTIKDKDRYSFDSPEPKFHAVHRTIDELMKDMREATTPLKTIQEELIAMLKDNSFTSKKSLVALEEKVLQLEAAFREITPNIGNLKKEAANNVVDDFKDRLLKQAQIELQSLPIPAQKLLFIPSM